MKVKTYNFIKTASLYIFLGLLAYVPFHIFLSTWLGTSFGVLDFAKIAKDIVLIIGFLLALSVSLGQPWFKAVAKQTLVLLVVAYGLLTLFMALLFNNDQVAEIVGVVYNMRFLVFFLYAVLVSMLFDPKKLLNQAVKVVLVTGLAVSIFGVVQYLVLPDDILKNVGYSRANGVLPMFHIDDKPDLERVISFQREPNSLGGYLITIALLSFAGIFLTKRKKLRYGLIAATALAVMCLVFTFSRGAFLGLLVAGLTYIAVRQMLEQSWFVKHRKKILIAAVASSMLFGAVFIATRNTYFVQNVVFHADESTVLEDPNELRLRFWQESIDRTADNPLGIGPGTAGLASIKNDEQGVILNENYYLQLLTEVGIQGLVLFLAINVLLLLALLKVARNQKSIIALAMIAAFVGISFTNLLVHNWSNEAVAYTWWGLAGILFASQLMKKVPKRS